MNDKKHCEEALDALMASLEQGKPSPAELEKLYLAFPQCSEVIRETVSVWEDMETLAIPEPGPHMHANFYHMLMDYEQKQSFLGVGENRNTWSRGLRYGLVAAVFILGLTIGLFVGNDAIRITPNGSNQNQIALQQYLDFVSNPSATERLGIVQGLKEEKRINEVVIQALNQTVLNDPNVNVRLAAIETMVYFSDHPEMRELLLRAIPHQDNPIVQLTLAEVMIEFEETRAVEQFEEMMLSQEVEEEVKQDLEEKLKVLY